MTVSENASTLALTWQKYINEIYSEVLQDAFDEARSKCQLEGLQDLNSLVIKIPLEVDFSNLIDFNPEFYEYFNSASPEELKGLIRESSIEFFQKMNLDENLKLDKRQISVEIFLNNLPCTTDTLMNSREFYQQALPKLYSENLDLKGIWDYKVKILTGRIISLSESFNLIDIKTFACTNSRCGKSHHVLRHVGFEDIEQTEELGPLKANEEVFIRNTTGESSSLNIIKCHNCRENISELFPFRSTIEFKVAKFQIDGNSCFSIGLLLVGSATCSKAQLSKQCSLIGFPKLSVDLTKKLNFTKSFLGSHYFEVYGIDLETNNLVHDQNYIEKLLEIVVQETCDCLSLPLLILICQIVGSANGIHFNTSLIEIDKLVLTKISKLFCLIYDSNNTIGSLKTNSVNLKTTKKMKELQITDESHACLVNIVGKDTKVDDNHSYLFTEPVVNDQIITIPVNLSPSDEAEIILKDFKINHKFPLPKVLNCPQLSSFAVNVIQEYFLTLRSSKIQVQLKSGLNLLTKLAQISAISRGNDFADEKDAEFSTMIHSKLFESSIDEINFDLMTPSTSFDSNFINYYLKVRNILKNKTSFNHYSKCLIFY